MAGSTSRNRRQFFFWIAVLIGAAPRAVLAGAPSLNAAAGINPANFRYTAFATGLNFPVGVQSLSDGSLLVGTSNPVGNSGVYGSTGSLVRFVDANHDGVADNPAGTVVYNGLPGTLTSLQQAGNLLVVTSGGISPSITFLRMSSPTSYSLLGTENLSFPIQSNGQSWEHTTYAAAVQPTAGLPGSYDLFFNIGSQADNVTTPASTTVSASGLFTATLHGDSIYRVRISGGASPAFSAVTQIASGLRNAAGIAFQPGTGDLYFNDNGIDNGAGNPTYTNTGKEYSADKINKITANQLGSTIPDFGFAHDVILESDGSRVGDGTGVQPLQTFRALPNSTQSEGPSQIAFAPSSFPDGLNGGIFVSFHGGPFVGAANAQNPLVYYDPATNDYFHFIEAGQAGLGHIDGLLSTSDALFMSDLNTSGSLYDSSGAGSGAIYELVAVPEPASTAIVGTVAILLAAQRRPRPAR